MFGKARRNGSDIFHMLSFEDTRSGVEDQLSTGTLHLPPVTLPPGSDRDFATTADLWSAVLSEEVRARRTVVLHDVLLSEWFPRSPGLYHTRDAALFRQEAQGYLMALTDEQRAYYARTSPPGPGVFDLYGKLKMLAGGIGCIRLNRRNAIDGSLWFMSASSSLFAEQGIPVALDDDMYARCIEQIGARGVFECTITGKLMLLPDNLLSLFEDYRGVPRVYIQVERIEPPNGRTALDDGAPIVSAAVMFATEEHGGATHAAFMNFVPGRGGTLAQRLPWLDHYVNDLHAGTVITDFDEQVTRYPHAIFSLRKISSGTLLEPELRGVAATLRLNGRQIAQLLSRQGITVLNQTYVEKLVKNMGDSISITGDGNTLINRSSLTNALNALRTQHDDHAATLEDLASAVTESQNAEALDSLNGLTEELEKTSSSKSRLRMWLGAIVTALPDVAKVAAAAESLGKLWS